MKKLTKAILITAAILTFNIYAGDSTPPTTVLESYEAAINFPPGSTIPSLEEGNVDPIIDGRLFDAAVKINNVVGTYENLFEASIWGGSYGIYAVSNDPIYSKLTIKNNGDIRSDNMIGVNLVGVNGKLNNTYSGTIYGGSIGLMIDAEISSNPTYNPAYEGFDIYNAGKIEGGSFGIFMLSETDKDIYITNSSTGNISGYSYGIVARSFLNLNNQGLIESTIGSALNLMKGSEINNSGTIRSDYGDSIGSFKPLILTGDGQYTGNITYTGTAENLSLHSYLWLNDTRINFKNARFKNWGSLNVSGGENYFNVDYNFQSFNNSRSDVYLTNGAILHTGDGSNGVMNLHIDDGLVNPYENNYDGNNDGTGTGFFWNRYAEQYFGGPQYYDVRKYEKLTINNLTMGSKGGLIIDIKNAKPNYDDDLFQDRNSDEGFTHPDDTYAGYGYAAFKGSPIPDYTRVNHDTIDVKGTVSISSGATLYLVDHTLESSSYIEAEFDTYTHLEINALDGNLSFDDFNNIEFYSRIYGIDHFDNDTGIVYLTHDAFDPNQRKIIDWWIKEATFGFAEAAGFDTFQTQSAIAQSGSLLPYEVSKAYSAKITELETTEALQQTIYSFQAWNDIETFMDSLNKLEYASLATSNLNLISNRVNQMFDRLSAGHMRDNNGLNIWGDVYFSNDSLDGTGNHGIDGHGTEFAAGVDKMFNNTTFGLSTTYTDYTSTVNDDDVHTDIESIGFGLNLYMMMDQGNLRHKAMLGYASYSNTSDDAQDFDSSEMFASYRAEWTFKTDSLEIKPFAGLRYSFVQFDEMREDAENGLKAFDQDSLESELGVKLVKQFKRLGVSVSGAWMHEFLDSQTTAEAFTSFGNFSQDGIARDTDSFRATIGFEYKLTNKVTLDFDLAKELSDNSESDSINGKITFRF